MEHREYGAAGRTRALARRAARLARENEALREALAEAEESNQAKSRFLSNMSHDIRTPMNAIMGMTSIAQSHIDEKARVKDCLEKIRTATKEAGVVLVFDEITAGFRLCPGGSHKVLGTEPDIAVFAKGMTNGYPLSAIIGKKDIMEAAQGTFISSTFWTERITLAAAVKAIECYQKYQVAEHQSRIGKYVKEGWTRAAEKTGVQIHTSGILPLIHFEFAYDNVLAHKTYFTQQMLKKGYLAATALYVSLAHTEEIVEGYLDACRCVFQEIAQIHAAGKQIEDYLDGPVCHAGLERLN